MTAPLSSLEPADAHPSVEELADLTEGLVEPAEAAEALRRHLDGCAECRETADALAEVQTLLGAVEPEPMPADVAARLDAALAEAARAESTPAEDALAEGSSRPQEAAGTDRRTVTPAPSARTAAAPSAPPSRPASATGPGRPRPRRRRAGLLLGAAAVLAALGLGGALLVNSSAPDHPAVTAGAPAGTSAADQSARTPRSSGPVTVYQEDRLAAQVQQLLTRSGTAPGLRATGPAKSDAAAPAEGVRPEPDTSAAPNAAASPPAPAQPSPATCPAPAPGTPLATDRGSFQGVPVDVLVYPAPGRPGFVDVYLRSPGCGPVVLQRTVPRG
ncbi:hypothetical protein ACH4E7_03620 [Kitasatospora sp. NPDC018058]|uniref:hypothetical protein n=1 Tax=Kitasatospora sp. NPDC018058 TaxID=3364025 RepID=UPI0037C19D96